METEKLKQAFAQSLGLPLSAITDDLAYNTIPAWDSVGHMALIAAVEQAFDILLETEDVLNLSSFAKARTILEKYGVQA